MNHWLHDLLNHLLPADYVEDLYIPTMLLSIAIIAVLSFLICHRVISVAVRIITRNTATEWDDDLLNDKVLKAASQLVPALVVAHMLPDAFESGTTLHTWLTKLTDFYILWACIHLVNSFLQALFDALDRRGRYRIHTMRGVLQMLKLFFIIIGIIIGISIVIGKSPIAILTALGASAAVLMLVFQDTILGLVAGIQLTVNDMLKKGDWIIVPKADANGEVEEVSLTTVKVRNWDNSVTTIPPYTLIKDSFHNYDPMRESGGRRVSRYVYIDINSVRFLNAVEIEHLVELKLVKPEQIEDPTKAVNLHLLSIHLEDYLKNHPAVRPDLLYMVRQLQPTANGIPLELYFFTSHTEWKSYEHVQAQILDYVYAGLNEFKIALYQAPSGTDVRKLQPSKTV